MVETCSRRARQIALLLHAFTKYLSKLHPNSERLWCYPKDIFNTDDDTWYTMKPIGVNTRNKVLPGLSELFGLSQSYTNYFIRVTMVIFHQQGFQMKDEQSVSEHKFLQSLAGNHHTSTSKKHICPKKITPGSQGTGKQTI